jgi:hypothetical protein
MIIKKLNTMFHKHSRILFGAFTIIIIIAFMDFLTPQRGGCDSFGGGSKSNVGMAFGKKVSVADLQDFSRAVSIYFDVFEGRQIDLDYEQLFYWYCMSVKAEKSGVVVSDGEVADFIRSLPVFFTGGKFDAKKYRKLADNLETRGISEDDLAEAVRLQLEFAKLRGLLAGQIVVTPSEVETLYRTFYTKMQIAAAAYTAASVTAKPTKEQLEAFFHANQARYRIERRVAAAVVEIPNGDFIPAARKNATPERLESFYNLNKSLFSDKDGKVKPFAQVKGEVMKRFLEEETAELAKQRAYDFASAIYENMNVPAERREAAFAAAAKQAGLRVNPVSWIAAGDEAVGKVKSRDLVNALFAAAESNPVTDAIEVPGAVCVGCMVGHTPARDAKISDVPVARLEEEWRVSEARKMAIERAEELNKVVPVKARYQAFRALKNVKFTDFAFTQSGNPAPPAGMEAAMSLSGAPDGSVTAIPDLAGAMVFFLRGRELPDASGFDKAKAACEFMCRAYKQELAQRAFEEDINRNCQFLLKSENQR